MKESNKKNELHITRKSLYAWWVFGANLNYTLQVSDDKQIPGDKALDTKRTDNNKNEKSVSSLF